MTFLETAGSLVHFEFTPDFICPIPKTVRLLRFHRHSPAAASSCIFRRFPVGLPRVVRKEILSKKCTIVKILLPQSPPTTMCAKRGCCRTRVEMKDYSEAMRRKK